MQKHKQVSLDSTFKSIVKQAVFCLCKSSSNIFLEPTSTKQWLNEGKVSCSKNQKEALMGLKLTTD